VLSVFDHEYFMKEALKEAKNAYDENEIPVGAVVVCQNKIIARAYNQTEKLTDVTAHAEMLAITAAENFLGSKFLDQCEMFVTLEPCNMCAGALYWSRIGKLVIAAKDAKRGFTLIGNRLLHPSTKYVEGVLADSASSLLNDFFEKLRD
jgi:tRNA(adenine34) deaminase